MAKARAIVKRRKAVRNIRKITKTMQMIATAKFQKSLRRAVATKPYSLKVRELVRELASSVGGVEHPLLRRPGAGDQTNRIAVVVITSNRGLAGAYNGNVLRMATHFLRQQESAGKSIDLYVTGKKGASAYNYQKRAIKQRVDISDNPRFAEVEPLADTFIEEFTTGKVDAVYVAYMNFISAGSQKPEMMTLLPLAGVDSAAPAGKGGVPAQPAKSDHAVYEFSPSPEALLNELLPLTVRTALFQAYLDSTTSEHVARMISMKSATDAADKMIKSLTMKYNRARQSQITTELAEIMGGVEAMKG
ncbi:MAG TPA: ATP synthase F1 subunit gamma [Tepidisphaeraceae bacterium]|jgi:F-type H+-transporting ATPase subunit gamma|nr:ATP synthase F1 subunit gamma [Tepidisphaeraceae bacterium]